MSFLISYSLSPVRQQGLNEAMDVFIDIRHPNNLPAIGKQVSLKLVKPTNFKIKNIKTSISPNGLINNIINPNSSEGCLWDPIYCPEKVLESTSEIKDFCLSKTGKIYPLLSDSLQIEKDYKIKGIKGKKNLITQNGDYIIAGENIIYWIHSSLANLIQTYNIKESILDICLDEKNVLYILTNNFIFTLSKGNLREFPLSVKDNSKIHVYQDKIYLTNGIDCTVLKGSVVVDGFTLLSESKTENFSSFQQYLVYTTSDLNKIYIYNVLTQEYKELDLHFLSLPIKNIKIDQNFNIYFSISNFIFRITQPKQNSNIDLIFENQLMLESFTINTSGLDKLKIIAFDLQKEWVIWEDFTNLELKDYVIPVENKILGLRFEWNGTDSRVFNKIGDFYIQGSANFAQIMEPTVLTDKNGRAKFTYVARKVTYPEKFVAIVK